MPVSFFDITEFIGDTFKHGAKTPSELADIAARRGARPGVVLTLRRLPDRAYRDVHEVGAALPDLPEDSDPWNAAG